MTNETHSGEVAQMIADAAREAGFQHTAPQGDAGSLFGRLIIKAPNGQTFVIQIEEAD